MRPKLPEADRTDDGDLGRETLSDTSSRRPERIGPYRILKVLGEGGMGTVYLAEQTEPLRRRVAIKLIRAGAVGPEAARRFAAERQALARMNHPNIAQAFEAGTAEDGQPYFVMEHVAGLPITGYCDQQRLPLRRRLELFLAICDGVQHAHQKAILHRDIKPSNLLVTEDHHAAVPKVIDFGVAKALDQPLTDGTLFTGNRLLGTPAYMSSEAIRVSEGGLDVDTRTDVYSLGVVLYELLVGALPFETSGGGFVALARKILDDEAPSPLQRFAAFDEETRASRADRRGASPRALRSRLRGDLEWISMKAIARDRERRYASAAELAADVERHLQHQPVLAGPPSTTYRIKKFVRRNHAAVAAALLAVLALVAGFAGRTLEAQRANREAERANFEAQRANREAARANREAEAARQVSEFLTDLFELSEPGEARGNTITAREILDLGATKIRTELAGHPLTQARLMDAIGTVHFKLGLYEPAVGLLSEALAIRRAHLDEDHVDLASTLYNLARVRRKQGRYRDAEPLFERSLEIRRQALGPNHPEVAVSLNGLATLYLHQNRYAEAEPLFQRSIEIQERTQPDLELSNTLNNLAALYWYEGRYSEAEPLNQRALAIREKSVGADHPLIAHGLGNLALLYTEQERYTEAEPLYRRALEIQEKVQGPHHSDVAQNLLNLGDLLSLQGKPEEAEPLLQRSLAIFEQAHGPDSIVVAHSLHGLAEFHRHQQRYGEAESFYRRALWVRERLLEPGHADLKKTVAGYASLMRSTGREAEAAVLEAKTLAASLRSP